MNVPSSTARSPTVRQLFAGALVALGCSFSLVALHGGDSVIAAAMLMTACSTAALLVRALGARELVDHLNDAGDVARDR
jgi:hypothetical protein